MPQVIHSTCLRKEQWYVSDCVPTLRTLHLHSDAFFAETWLKAAILAWTLAVNTSLQVD